MRDRSLLVAAAVLGMCAVVQAAPLFSNGPLITSPNGGTGAIAGLPLSKADAFPLTSTFNGATTGIGATANAVTPTAIADDFVVPAGGWNLDSLTVYAYQTSQTTASITRVHVNLWTAKPYTAESPDLPAGTPVPTPVLAGDLILDAGPGTFVAHRVSGSSTNTVRPVFSYTVSLDGLPNGGQLSEGTYWMEWSFEGATTPSITVFAPLVSPRPTSFNTNARLLNDPGVNGLPFSWFEGREGFTFDQIGRPYAFAFELGGSVIPEPSSVAVIGASTLGLLSRRRRI